MSDTIPHLAALRLYLAAIAGDEPCSSQTEIRWREGPGQPMHQEFWFCQAHRPIVERVAALAPRGDVYLGVSPRIRCQGTADAIERTWTLRVDVDHDDALARLRAFSPLPSIVVRTGTAGNAQALWALRTPLANAHVARANRRLAFALGADMACADVARVFRAPATANHKHDPPVPVDCVRLEPTVFTAAEVVGHLPDPPQERRESGRPLVDVSRLDDDDVLRSIAASDYVPALTGRDVGRDGKARCPFHAGGDERTPSLHAYADPDRGWFCFGCEDGGSIIDFGARLFAIDPRGRGYHDIRRRLAAELLAATA